MTGRQTFWAASSTSSPLTSGRRIFVFRIDFDRLLLINYIALTGSPSMNDPFLQKVGVANHADAMRNSLRAALQRNKTYMSGTPQNNREAFRRAWAALVTAATTRYSQPVTDEAHCHTISQIASFLTRTFGSILIGGRLRFGTSQKAFNLYLKFLWRLGVIPPPPHCPVDGVVLRIANLAGSWTQSDSETEYLKWIAGLRKLAAQATLAGWEYAQWNRKS